MTENTGRTKKGTFDIGNNFNRKSGRKRGRKNKMTMTIKQAFEEAFRAIGAENGLTKWAEKNPTEFYRLFAKMLPTAAAIDVNQPSKIEIVNYVKQPKTPTQVTESTEVLSEQKSVSVDNNKLN